MFVSWSFQDQFLPKIQLADSIIEFCSNGRLLEDWIGKLWDGIDMEDDIEVVLDKCRMVYL